MRTPGRRCCLIPRWLSKLGRPLLPFAVRRRVGDSLMWLELYLGLRTWPTKDFAFWVLLELLLLKGRPRCVAEFGSGRSTNVLAGYAHKHGAQLISIEDNPHFIRKVRAGLRGTLLPTHYVHRAQITRDRWYDVHAVKVAMTCAPDMLLIDGPNVAVSGGLRHCPAAIACYQDFMASVRILLVDDVDRQPEYRMTVTLLTGTALTERYFVKDSGGAITCIAMTPDLAAEFNKMLAVLNLPTATNPCDAIPPGVTMVLTGEGASESSLALRCC